MDWDKTKTIGAEKKKKKDKKENRTRAEKHPELGAEGAHLGLSPPETVRQLRVRPT